MRSNLLRSCSFVAVFCLLFAVQAFSQTSTPDSPAYLDPSLPIDKRVDDLVGRMTLEEKVSQVVHLAQPIPRLQIPAYNWWTEALHGVVTDHVTVFPEPIGLAATFNAPLIHEMGTVIGTEARARHHEDVRKGNFTGVGLDFWAPNVNIFRDPRWGRGQETYGEDPYLTGRMAVAYVTGMQGDDRKYLRVITTPKHYAVHSGPEPLRHRFDAQASKHDMLDTYLPAFRAAVTEGQAGSVMCVYNRVNGEPGCASTFLLEDQLRKKWGFNGYVVSDCDAVYDIQRGHHYTQTLAEAAAVSMKRGTDLDCNDPGSDYSRYRDAVKQGLLSEQELDTAVKRLFRARFRLGMFDPPEMVKYAQIPASEADSEPHRQLALQAARQSMVLLKNNGVLPLKTGVKRIAVVGPLADSLRVLQGNYNGSSSRMTTALEGIRRQFPKAQVSFMPGTRFLRDSARPIPGKWLAMEDGTPGLKAEYFRGMDLAGAPVVTRVDKDVNFDFNGGSPAPGLTGQNFSVRWTGVLIPAASDQYEIGVTADDGYRLWLDGKLVVEDWTTHAPSTRTVQLQLNQGQRYALKLEYFQAGGAAVAKLVWKPKMQPESEWVKEAVEISRKAEVVVAVVGITSDLEAEETTVDIPGFRGGDRTSIDLPQPEEELLKAMKATGRPLVIVLMNGSALAINWAQQNADAVLEAWYAGEEGGTAIAETLAGVNNPAGRLPVTFYTGLEQLPNFEDYSMKGRTYRYFQGKPLYPFGYGLSYSQFVYSNLKLSTERLKAGDPLTVEADIRNVSARPGDEVAQVYLTFPDAPGAPIRALRGFVRIHLAAGESKHVQVTLNPRDLSMVSESGNHLIAAGKYRLSLGGGQPGTGAPGQELAFSIVGEQALPE